MIDSVFAHVERGARRGAVGGARGCGRASTASSRCTVPRSSTIRRCSRRPSRRWRASRATVPVVFPVHPRTRGHLIELGHEATLVRAGVLAQPAARLPRVPRPPGGGALRAHRLRRRPGGDVGARGSAASRCATRPSGRSRSSSGRTSCSAPTRPRSPGSRSSWTGGASHARSRSGTERQAHARPRCCDESSADTRLGGSGARRSRRRPGAALRPSRRQRHRLRRRRLPLERGRARARPATRRRRVRAAAAGLLPPAAGDLARGRRLGPRLPDRDGGARGAHVPRGLPARARDRRPGRRTDGCGAADGRAALPALRPPRARRPAAARDRAASPSGSPGRRKSVARSGSQSPGARRSRSRSL